MNISLHPRGPDGDDSPSVVRITRSTRGTPCEPGDGDVHPWTHEDDGAPDVEAAEPETMEPAR